MSTDLLLKGINLLLGLLFSSIEAGQASEEERQRQLDGIEADLLLQVGRIRAQRPIPNPRTPT